MFSEVDRQLSRGNSAVLDFELPVETRVTVIDPGLWTSKQSGDSQLHIRVDDLVFIDPGFSILGREPNSWKEFVSPLAVPGMTCTALADEVYRLEGGGIAVEISFMKRPDFPLDKLVANSCVPESQPDIQQVRSIRLRRCA